MTISGQLALAMALSLVLGTLGAAALVRSARGQIGQEPHEHGVTVPDWYSAECCDRKDCRPVPDDEIDYGVDSIGNPVVIHKPTGIQFEKSRWRVSQDERFHPCFRPTGNTFTAYCVYLPGGA